jgi:2,4-dienoyl-CoA reductase-like NADH-dependent reductase (Old Yellow Enzyme family)
MKYRRIAAFKTVHDFRLYLQKLEIDLPADDNIQSAASSPLAQPFHLKNSFKIGNRFCVLPMEGWDGRRDGKPSGETMRRWANFGKSGAKLIWGGEAVAVRHDGRANPRQLLIAEQNLAKLASLRETLIFAHKKHFERADDLYTGLQLTHSGRFSRPNHRARQEPKTLYQHPILDKKFHVDANAALLCDDDIARLVDDFVHAAKLARRIGFDFVDIKHCHGYLGHEFLSAVARPGRYGGALKNRMRFLQEIVDGIRTEAPDLEIGVRLSVFDCIPFRAGADGIGEPEPYSGNAYPLAFGGNSSGTGIDLHEPIAFLKKIESLGIQLVCLTAGSPYYSPHIQRPALFPPSDGYLPPEDPLAGVARQINVTAEIKKRFPDLAIVGSGYSYLQEFLPNVAQNVVRERKADFVGLGRMVLCYPEMPADVLAGRVLQRKRLCRTFSDCTTAPRNGLISGCYPLDEFYKSKPEARHLKTIKMSFTIRRLSVDTGT